jgi:cytochrome P450
VDVTSEVVFGRDLGTLSGRHSDLQTHLSNIFHMMNTRVNALVPYWRVVKLPRDREVERSLQVIIDLVRGIIGDTRREMAADPTRTEHPRTLLEAMLVAQDDDDPAARFSDDEVIGNVMTLLLAGEDTTSNTLTWMLHYLAHEPAVQRALREEADAVLGDARVVSNYEDVAKLGYAIAVTHETLRMRSAAPVLFMEANRDTELAGMAVTQGQWVFCVTRHCGMLDTSFSDAECFRPERWLEGQAPAVHQPRAAMAFGAGPRTCPGRSLALFECAMVASMIARNFEVRPVSGRDEVEELFDFTMQPVGLRVQLVARSGASVQ